MAHENAPDGPVMFDCESCGEAVPRAHTVCSSDGMRMCWFCCSEFEDDDLGDDISWDDDDDYDDDWL